MATVDPQNHRRMSIVGGADGFPLFWPERFQGFLQPARVRGAHYRVVFQLDQQGFALALCITQHRVEQGFGPGFFQLVSAAHGFANGGVGRNAGVQQLIQTHQQQRLDISVGGLERFLQQLVGQRRQTWLPTGGTECQILGQAAITCLNLVQLQRQRAVERCFAVQDCSQCLGGGQTRIHCAFSV